MTRYTSLLAPGALGALTLPNRVLMAPMSRGRAAADGTPSPLMQAHFAQRASAGLLITDATAISPQAIGFPHMPGLWTEPQAAGFAALARAVHDAGGRIAVHLTHCGRLSLPAWQPDRAAPVSASAIPAAATTILSPRGSLDAAAIPRALELEELAAMPAQFAAAARTARSMGCDAVEIQAGDGHLIDQFLRDGANQRHDRYGGSPANRGRLLYAVIEAVAKAIGADRTGVRITPTATAGDMRDSNPLLTFSTVVRDLASFGLAWLHVAAEQNGDLVYRLRDVYAAPLVVSASDTPDRADGYIREELAAAVSFGTPFIANPDLVKRLRDDLPLASPDPDTLWLGGERGYLDYPTYDSAAAAER